MQMTKSIKLTKELTLQGEPFLIFLTMWLSVKFKQGSILKLSVNNRQPIVIAKYLPGSKFYAVEIVKDNDMPSIKVQYNEHQVIIDISQYQNSSAQEQTINIHNGKLHFLYEKFKKTDEIYKKYQSQKPDEIERYRMNESITDIIRSQAEFVRMIDKDEDIEMMKRIQKIEKDMENQLSDQLLSVSTAKFSIKSIIIALFVFMLLGYFIGQPEKQKKRQRKRTKKLKSKKR